MADPIITREHLTVEHGTLLAEWPRDRNREPLPPIDLPVLHAVRGGVDGHTHTGGGWCAPTDFIGLPARSSTMTDTTTVPEPTSQQCTDKARLTLDDGRPAHAIWWPKMGGYGGRALVVGHTGGCGEVYVWHDGEFPFSSDGPRGRQPVQIHVCDPEQWVELGHQLCRVLELDEDEDEDEDTDCDEIAE